MNGGKRKQEVIVGDGSRVGEGMLWEEHTDRLEEGKLLAKRFLLMARDSCEVMEVADIGEVEVPNNSDDDDGEVGGSLSNAQIIAVPQLDSYKSCLICKARVELSDPPLGQCSKCLTSQRYNLCGE